MDLSFNGETYNTYMYYVHVYIAFAAFAMGWGLIRVIRDYTVLTTEYTGKALGRYMG